MTLTIRPDFTELIRAFGELGKAVRAAREGFAQIDLGRATARPLPPPSRRASLTAAYHRRHVRNRRRRSCR